MGVEKMKKWGLVAIISALTLIIGFTMGFCCGEKVYSWVIVNFFHNPNGEFDMYIVWTAIAGIGTISLGCVSLWQTRKANQTNANMLFEQKINTKRPHLTIEKVCAYSGSKQEEEFHLPERNLWSKEFIDTQKNLTHHIVIKNVGEGVAVDIEECENSQCGIGIPFKTITILNQGGALNLVFSEKAYNKQHEITYRSITGVKFKQLFNISCHINEGTFCVEVFQMSTQEVIKENHF